MKLVFKSPFFVMLLVIVAMMTALSQASMMKLDGKERKGLRMPRINLNVYGANQSIVHNDGSIVKKDDPAKDQ